MDMDRQMDRQIGQIDRQQIISVDIDRCPDRRYKGTHQNMQSSFLKKQERQNQNSIKYWQDMKIETHMFLLDFKWHNQFWQLFGIFQKH